jgi:tetratricopeptide (TPR) repeat protein
VNLLREKKYAEAEAEFASSVEDAKTPFALRGLFSALLYQHKDKNVLDAYEAFGARSPLRSQPSLLLLAGDACMHMGEYDRAASFYRRVEDLRYNSSSMQAAVLRRLAAADTVLVRIFLESTYGGMNDSTRLSFLSSCVSNPSASIQSSLASGVVSWWLGLEYRKNGDRNAAGMMFEHAAYALNDKTAQYGASMAAGDAFFEAGLYDRALAMLWYANNVVPINEPWIRLQEKIALVEFVQRTVQE